MTEITNVKSNKMSLVSAVLEEAQKAEIQDFKKQVEQIGPQVIELTERTQMLSWSLQQNLINFYLEFAATESLEELNYEERNESIMSDYKELTERLKAINLLSKGKDETFDNCWVKLETSYSLLNNLGVAVQGSKILLTADHTFRRYNYSEAILSVEALRGRLRNIKFDGDVAVALQNLRNRADNQLALYNAHISMEWKNVFLWSEQKSLNTIVYSIYFKDNDAQHINKLLTTLYSTHRLNAELAMFSHFFTEKVLHNVILHNCEIFTDDYLQYIVYNIKIDLSDTSKPSFHTIFNNIMAIFEFIQSKLIGNFDDEKSFITVLAESLRDRFFNKIINDCIKNHLPSCDGSYKNYQELVVELDTFNNFLIDLKFVNETNSPLKKYVEDTQCILYKKKCDKLLTNIRTLLSESLSYGTITVGVRDDCESETDVTNKEPWNVLDKPLFLPECVISQNVQKIFEITIEHVKESVGLPETYRNLLILYIKNIAVMYQGLVPKKFKANLECCPLDIALFFNNCFYLAHSLLGPPWRSIVPAKMADDLNMVLIECIQDLRVLGLEKMSLYLQKQTGNIMTSVQVNDQSPWSYDIYEEFDYAISEALNLMRDLKCSWFHVLPARMYEKVMCTLAEALAQAILNRLLNNIQQIDDKLVYMIAVKIDDTIVDVKTLFEETTDLDKRIKVWSKFSKMPKVLRAQLFELSECWNKSKELTQVYTCEEVRQIIKMRFPEDSYRFKILAEIQ